MDIDLDRRLRDSAPDTAPLPDLALHRTRILAEARAGRARRLRVWIGSAAASVLLVGGGSVAVATSEHMTPWGWLADNSVTIERSVGPDCFIGMRVRWDGLAEDDPMVRDAQRILAAMDLTSLDIGERLAEDTARNDALAPQERQSSEEVRLTAISTVAAWATFDELDALGYEMRPGREVSIAADGTACR